MTGICKFQHSFSFYKTGFGVHAHGYKPTHCTKLHAIAQFTLSMIFSACCIVRRSPLMTLGCHYKIHEFIIISWTLGTRRPADNNNRVSFSNFYTTINIQVGAIYAILQGKIYLLNRVGRCFQHINFIVL